MGAAERGFKEEGEISLPQAAEGPGKMGTQCGLCGSSREDLGQSRLVEEVGGQSPMGWWVQERTGGRNRASKTGRLLRGLLWGYRDRGRPLHGMRGGRQGLLWGFFKHII